MLGVLRAWRAACLARCVLGVLAHVYWIGGNGWEVVLATEDVARVGVYGTESLERWERGLPEHGAHFARAWRVACERLVAQCGLDDESCKRLRDLAVTDVTEMVDALADRDVVGRRARDRSEQRRVLAAWVQFYPRWVAARLGDLRRDDPDALASAVERSRRQSERDRAANAAWHRHENNVAVGGRLLAVLDSSPTGSVRWEPAKLARRVVRPGRGRQPSGGPYAALDRMAAALVSCGAAVWETTPSGKRWALSRVFAEQVENGSMN